jgi:hypothetical protein
MYLLFVLLAAHYAPTSLRVCEVKSFCLRSPHLILSLPLLRTVSLGPYEVNRIRCVFEASWETEQQHDRTEYLPEYFESKEQRY